MAIVKKDTRYLETELSEDEVMAVAKELSTHIHDRTQLDEEKKRITKTLGDKVKGLDVIISEKGKVVETGRDVKSVAIEIKFHHPKTGFKTIVRTDTYDIVEEAEMREYDYDEVERLSQLEIPFING